ncbi:MAG TPA: hypothetical protein VFN46_04670 [Acetobacteraceae bacterium]|nr:hypothetical protein [Acetobacteraceae bacterium]
MIRPFTFVTLLLAAGAGLYLYQAKQQGRVLDRQIDTIRNEAAATHQRAEVLRAEYTLLNDPTRLAELVAAHLPDLKPTQPAQWTSMAELDKRLPPVGNPTEAPAPLEPSAPDAVPPQHDLPPMAAAEPAHPTTSLPAATPVPPAPRQAPAVARMMEPRPIIAVSRREPAAPALHPTLRVATAHVAPARAAPVRVAATRLAPVPLAPPSRGGTRADLPAAPTTPVMAALRPVPLAPATEHATARVATPEPTAPVVASALGMARMLTPVSPANAATLQPGSATR